MRDKVNIMYIVDSAYARYLIVNAYSIIKNNPSYSYTFYIISTSLSAIAKRCISSFGKNNGCKIVFISVDVSIFNGLKSEKSVPAELYYKIVPHYVLPTNVDKIVYMDIDMIVDGRLDDLFNLKFDNPNIYFYACWDVPVMRRLAKGINHPDNGYVNSGVMVINLDALRDNEITIDDYRCALNYEQTLFEEQLLHELMGKNGHIAYLKPYCYNYNVGEHKVYEEYCKKNNDVIMPIIRHYMGYGRWRFSKITKPWQLYFFNYTNVWSERDMFEKDIMVWWKYALQTEFANDFLIESMSTTQKYLCGVIEIQKGQNISNKVDCDILDEVCELLHKSDSLFNFKYNFYDHLIGCGNVAFENIAKSFCIREAECNNLEFVARLARLYRDGKGFNVDYKKAAELMEHSIKNNGPSWSKNELFDILWAIGDPESLEKMIDFSKIEANRGDVELSARLARAYRAGKGVLRDLELAAKYMGYSAKNGGPLWSKYEYFDILWEIGSASSLKDMVDFIQKESLTTDPELLGRVGRCYFYGKGVATDINYACSVLSEAIKYNPPIWVKKLYVDTLWALNSKECDEILYHYLSSCVDENEYFEGYLGRMYRDGRFVTKNLHCAADWMRKGSKKNVSWIANELFDVLWELNTSELDVEMVSLVEASSTAGDGHACGRLARAYRFGRGVSRDEKKAIELYKKAIEKKVSWASKELDDMAKSI